MIRPINKQGVDCLYTPTIAVGPMITKEAAPGAGISLEGAQVESLTGEAQHGGFQAIWPEDVVTLVQDLKDTCQDIADSCMGLAATQIWWKKSPCPAIFVMRWPVSKEADPHHSRGWDWQEFINPIVKLSGKTLKMEEGCLSYPGTTVRKTRKNSVDFIYQTLAQPKQQRLKLNMRSHHWVPHVIQHEYDHLKGVCIRSKNWKKNG